MSKILVSVPGYLPGFKSGGPVRSIVNLVESLGDSLMFDIVCMDRDLGDEMPYPEIVPRSWRVVGKARVYYIEPGASGFIDLVSILRTHHYDAVYINSFFSLQFGIFLVLIINLLRLRVPIILSPKGEFSSGALSLKRLKKGIFLKLAKTSKFYRNVIWHASSDYESNDIRRAIDSSATVRVAMDIATAGDSVKRLSRSGSGPLRIVFISRVSPMKNLIGALNLLRRVHCFVRFDVFGPIEDRDYWNGCLSSAETLPHNIVFNYCGILQPASVLETLACYDLFLLPTFGENYGHVIAEALFAGVPLLISDKTPWRDLENRGIGWDIPLDQTERFIQCIEECGKKSSTDYDEWCQRIRSWAAQNIGSDEIIEDNRRLFMNLEQV